MADEPVVQEDESVVQEQLIYLVQDATDNIRLAKRTQWHVGYYTLLLYAAIVVVADRVADDMPPQIGYRLLLAVFGGILAFVTWGGGLFIVWRMQSWIKKHRTILEKTEENFCALYQQIIGNRSGNYTNIMYASEVSWLLSMVLTLAFLVSTGLVIMILAKY